jgi:hypothetical protein
MKISTKLKKIKTKIHKLIKRIIKIITKIMTLLAKKMIIIAKVMENILMNYQKINQILKLQMIQLIQKVLDNIVDQNPST